jgi:hypothetical protein
MSIHSGEQTVIMTAGCCKSEGQTGSKENNNNDNVNLVGGNTDNRKTNTKTLIVARKEAGP